MKRLIDFIDDYLELILISGIGGFILWFCLKVAAGLYHLLDKLIDKI